MHLIRALCVAGRMAIRENPDGTVQLGRMEFDDRVIDGRAARRGPGMRRFAILRAAMT